MFIKSRLLKFLWPYDEKVIMKVHLKYFNHRWLYLSRTKLEPTLHAAAFIRANYCKWLK